MKRIIVTIVLSVMGLAVLTGCSYSSGSSWPNSDTPDDYCCYDSDYEIPAQVVDFYEISFHSIGRDPWFPRIYNGHREDIEDVYDYCEEHREMLENVTIVDVTEDTCAIVIGS